MIRFSPADAATLQLLLAETPALTLATLDADGTPRATPLYFAADSSLRLLFLSDGETIHASNLTRRKEAAAALYPSVDDWRALRGLQCKGWVEALGAAGQTAEFAVYLDRFPFAATLTSQLETSLLFRLTPTWVRLIDNRRGFGFHCEWPAG